MPEHLHHFQYLFFGAHGKSALVPWMWASQIIALTALALLLFPKVRRQEGVLFVLCLGVVAAIWIEKGLGMVVTGFIPSPLGHYTEYGPTLPEGLITIGIYAIGFFILTVLYKVASSVREELAP